MFDATLTKPMLLLIGVLVVSTLSLSGYNHYLTIEKHKIQQQLTVTEQQLTNLNEKAKIERELYNKALIALRNREVADRELSSANDALRQELREILNNETDDCISSPLLGSVIRLLMAETSDSGSASTGVSP